MPMRQTTPGPSPRRRGGQSYKTQRVPRLKFWDSYNTPPLRGEPQSLFLTFITPPNDRSAMQKEIPVLLLFLSLAATGCRESRNEKQVFPLKGTVLVDGAAVEGIQITLHDKAGLDKAMPTFPQGVTDAQGNVVISTYAENDGAPQGEYAVTYVWKEFNVLSRSYSGNDKLNKKYSEPATTPFKVTIGPGQPNDLGTVELTTKK